MANTLVPFGEDQKIQPVTPFHEMTRDRLEAEAQALLEGYYRVLRLLPDDVLCEEASRSCFNFSATRLASLAPFS